MTQEILPNIIPVVIVEFSLNFSYDHPSRGITGLSGVGVQTPSPDWGLQVNEGSLYALIAPWVMIFPSIAISILVLSINVFADILGRILVGEGES
jgi:peptide/nickel transport system permease protein